jgi:(2R)-3-sulfolactate dehydrogenase (NADP+)
MTTTTIRFDALEALIVRALEASNTSPANARTVARALARAEAVGYGGHGFSRVPSYAAQARSGKVDGHAVPTATQPRSATMLVDARHGFAYPALDLAVDRLPALAASTGIAAAAITRSHHCGVVGFPLGRLAQQHGLVCLMFANTPHAMTAAGGRRPVFGTNPIGFSAPRRGRPPIVVDLALSQVARGKILQASQKGEQIPDDWALDVDGRPTTDAKAALKGTLRPLGGTKGAALALMVELLAVTLAGAHLAAEATNFFDGPGDPPGTGQLLIVLDPAGFAGREVVLDRIEALAAMIEGDPGARLPGAKLARDVAATTHVTVDAALLADVTRLGGSAD